MTEPAKYLFVRMDRMGDLILTLPCDQIETLNGKVLWLIPTPLSFIAENAEPKRDFIACDKAFSFLQFFKLVKTLKRLDPICSVVFFAPWWVSLAIWLARIPQRVGRYSQWHSFLFFNHGLRQKRSQAEKHELDYNFDLVEIAMDRKIPSTERKHLKLKAPNLQGVSLRNYIVVHPGMGGSAQNWPNEKYAQLIETLLARGQKVVITGTAADAPYLNPLRKLLSDKINLIWLDQRLSNLELLDVLAGAKAIVAPSTGVAHLAASLSVPTLGIYSAVTAESARRWAPLGPKVRLIEPKDRESDISDITVDSVLAGLERLYE